MCVDLCAISTNLGQILNGRMRRNTFGENCAVQLWMYKEFIRAQGNGGPMKFDV